MWAVSTVIAVRLASAHRPSVMSRAADCWLRASTSGAALVLSAASQLPPGPQPRPNVAQCGGADAVLGIARTVTPEMEQRRNGPLLEAQLLIAAPPKGTRQ